MDVALCIALVFGSSAGLGAVFDMVHRRRFRRLLVIARRALSSVELDLVPVTAADAQVLERQPAHAELVALGFTFAGDRREVIGDPDLDAFNLPRRFFISANGTVIASFSAKRGSASILSWTESGVFKTRTKPGTFAVPPSHRYQHVSATDPRVLVERHEKWTRLVAALPTEQDPVSSVRTIEDIVERTKRDHVRLVTWRNGHSDDDLLRKDLEGLLGAGYETRGFARLVRSLATKPPTARSIRGSGR